MKDTFDSLCGDICERGCMSITGKAEISFDYTEVGFNRRDLILWPIITSLTLGKNLCHKRKSRVWLVVQNLCHKRKPRVRLVVRNLCIRCRVLLLEQAIEHGWTFEWHSARPTFLFTIARAIGRYREGQGVNTSNDTITLIFVELQRKVDNIYQTRAVLERVDKYRDKDASELIVTFGSSWKM